jgi:hypothetical protein
MKTSKFFVILGALITGGASIVSSLAPEAADALISTN